jgi:hypothetical protein
MNRTKKSMGIIIVATMALMLVVGAGLSSTQSSYAHGKSHKDNSSNPTMMATLTKRTKKDHLTTERQGMASKMICERM